MTESNKTKNSWLELEKQHIRTTLTENEVFKSLGRVTGQAQLKQERVDHRGDGEVPQDAARGNAGTGSGRRGLGGRNGRAQSSRGRE